MKRFVKWLLICLAVLALAVLAMSIYLPYYHAPQDQGELALPGLKAPVKVVRDAKGMAYIHARDMDDLNYAHGFVTAQDRLFQMEVLRRLATGRICELAGEKARPLAEHYLTLGFKRNAERLAKTFDPTSRRFLQRYLDGVNYFIQQRPQELPLEFTLAGIKPTPWRIADSLALQFLVAWTTSANVKTEAAAQMILDKVGPDKLKEILPITLNPDEEGCPIKQAPQPQAGLRLGLARDPHIGLLMKAGPLGLSSNNWVAGPGLSAGGKPILANDPHLDARILPGPWYPAGLFIPGHRWVGVGMAGVPGIVVGRSDKLAWGVTNAYGDCQDLYVETIDPKDPGRYLEGGESVPFQVAEETITIKDKDAPGGIRREKIKVRLTRRGPVVSDVLKGVKTDRVLTLRWAPYESMQGSLGLDQAMMAQSAAQFMPAIQHMRHFILNFVVADVEGNIGWVVSGRLPMREPGQGAIPHVVKAPGDNWLGWIPDGQMPQAFNPSKGWLGTANHKTVTSDYPYYYSNRLAPSWRYRRLAQLVGAPGKKTAADHWAYQRDTMNLMARKLAPILAKALATDGRTKELARLLEVWDYHDRPDAAAPLVFQVVYNRAALLTFQDELGEDLARYMLELYYFWKERLAGHMADNQWVWFDDINTPAKETRDHIIVRAGKEVLAELGGDPAAWTWGSKHTLKLVSPIAMKGWLSEWLGSGSMPMGGSESTLLRGIYDFNKPYAVTLFDSLRMVVDLADNDKVWAVLPGGVSARLINPHVMYQVRPFMEGTPVHWWFSDRAIAEHAVTTLTLTPAN